MAGLPDDLRSLAQRRGLNDIPLAQRLMDQAADELDARAERILKLEHRLKRVSRILDPDFDLAPDDEWVQDLEMKVEDEKSWARVEEQFRTALAPLRRVPLRIDLPGGGTIWISR